MEGEKKFRTVKGYLSINQVKDKIFLIEDVDEKPYRIDRMLNQLKQAGVLDHLKGVILASWDACENDEETEEHLDLDIVLRSYFENASYPVLINLKCKLDAGQKQPTFTQKAFDDTI